MATNVKEEVEEKSEDKPVTDADIAALKEKSLEVEDSQESDETEEEAVDEKQSEDEAEAEEDDGQTNVESEDSKEGFKKKFDNIKGETPDEYASNLEVAYDNSTSEALKWKKMYEDALPTIKQAQAATGDADTPPILDPALAYAKQKMDEEMNKDIEDFAGQYSQIRDPDQYARLEKKVGILTKAIQEEEGRIPPMREVLSDAATLLKWEPDAKTDKLNMKLKDSAAGTKINSSAKPVAKSKVTPDQIKAARNINPLAYQGKTDAEIAKELEPYV